MQALYFQVKYRSTDKCLIGRRYRVSPTRTLVKEVYFTAVGVNSISQTLHRTFNFKFRTELFYLPYLAPYEKVPFKQNLSLLLSLGGWVGLGKEFNILYGEHKSSVGRHLFLFFLPLFCFVFFSPILNRTLLIYVGVSALIVPRSIH